MNAPAEPQRKPNCMTGPCSSFYKLKNCTMGARTLSVKAELKLASDKQTLSAESPDPYKQDLQRKILGDTTKNRQILSTLTQ